MNKNRIEGAAKQGEWATYHEALVTKARWRKCGGCAMKVCVLTWGDLALCLKGRRLCRSDPGGREGGTVKPGQTLPATKLEVRCMNTRTQGHRVTGSAKQTAGTGGLLEVALARQNLQAACKRVKANKGAAGVDGLSIEHTAHLLRQSRPEIRQALLTVSTKFT